MFRFLLLALTFILIYRLIAWLWKEVVCLPDRMKEGSQSKKRKPKEETFAGMDIEDADFEEIED